MKVVILAVAIACLAAGASAQTPSVLPPWGQCGGLSGVCGQTGKGPCVDAIWTEQVCPSGFTCTKDSQWYYQCLPTSTPVAPPATEESSAPVEESSTAPVSSTLAAYAQCGGKGADCGKAGMGPCEDAQWAGMQCPAGFGCKKHDQWYYQCEPTA